MDSNLFAKSLELMGIGMGMTFSFLILLVFMLNVLKWLVGVLNEISPEKKAETKPIIPAVQDDTKLKIAIALAAIKAAK
ncbi:MAG: OadG family protein [Elusimicrobiaceae bacterium]|nr:OadG family protein [Elusimicrobiaceae bacterium]